jgi:dTDP-glucose pyrophosphorylase
MTMLNIVMPMAGRGKRFADAGYAVPKPLIPVYGQPMTKVVIDNLRPTRPHRFIFIILQEHIDAFGMDQHLRSWQPDCIIVPVKEVTQGAACTVLLARAHIDSDQPLMIANCDQWVDVDIDEYLACMDRQNADGIIMTMWADDPKWSYCRFDGNVRMTEVVEKQVVSNEATVGIYNYRRGRDFVAAADEMIARDLRVNGEFYVAPAYNQLIARGQNIAWFNVGREYDGMYGLGIPKDLEIFNQLADRLVTRMLRMSKLEGRAATLNRLATAVGQSRGGGGTRVTFHERPQQSSQIGTVSDPMHQVTPAGIVVQGPLRHEDEFTLNTVRLYRRHFPHAAVVVSTWDTEDPAALATIRDAGATVITSRLPEARGPTNVNCQIVSTFAGVDWCRKHELTYVLKTRTDQRLYAPNVLDYLRTLLDVFPVVPGFRQTARIIGISLDTFKFRYYGLGDHLLFGTTADMHAFWSVDLDLRPFHQPQVQTWHEASMRNVVETYLTTEFLKKACRPIRWTLQDSLDAFADHFCIVDKDDLDLFWPKYEAHKEHRMLAYDAIKNTQELTSRDWLLLHRRQIDTAKIPEAGLHVPYGGHMY